MPNPALWSCSGNPKYVRRGMQPMSNDEVPIDRPRFYTFFHHQRHSLARGRQVTHSCFTCPSIAPSRANLKPHRGCQSLDSIRSNPIRPQNIPKVPPSNPLVDGLGRNLSIGELNFLFVSHFRSQQASRNHHFGGRFLHCTT